MKIRTVTETHVLKKWGEKSSYDFTQDLRDAFGPSVVPSSLSKPRQGWKRGGDKRLR